MAASTALLALPAYGSPLGLSPGDEIDTIEWDALGSNSDGANYTFDGSLGQLDTDGQITNVDLVGGGSILQSGVEFVFAADLVNYFQSGSFANATFTHSSAVSPDVSVFQNGNLILQGNFAGNFVIGGSLLSGALLAAVNISIISGDADLINAIGPMPLLELTASVFNFTPDLANLAGDGNIVNSNFSVDLSGTLRPGNPQPFVPEPSTAVLLGVGLLGLVAYGRRAR